MRSFKSAFITTFIKQNRWHRHSVLVHTLKVAYAAIKCKEYRMIPAALLHDVGKPIVAYQDEKDLIAGTYSFTNHEEISYRIIKKWPFVSDYTKMLVRNHYLIRGMKKAKEKGQEGKYRRMKRIYDKLSDEEIKDLKIFLKIDDMGK